MDQAASHPGAAPDNSNSAPNHSSGDRDTGSTRESTTVRGHTVWYEKGGHVDLGLKYLHNHSDTEQMFKDLKAGTEKDHLNYVKFEASGYTYKLYKKTGGYLLEYKY